MPDKPTLDYEPPRRHRRFPVRFLIRAVLLWAAFAAAFTVYAIAKESQRRSRPKPVYQHVDPLELQIESDAECVIVCSLFYFGAVILISLARWHRSEEARARQGLSPRNHSG